MVTYICNFKQSADLGKIADAMYDSLHPKVDKVLRLLNPEIKMTPRNRSWYGCGRTTKFSSVGTLLHDMNQYSVCVSYEPIRFPGRILVETSLLTKLSVQRVYQKVKSQFK